MLIAVAVGSTVRARPPQARGLLSAHATVDGIAGVTVPFVTGLFADPGATRAEGPDNGLLVWGATVGCGAVAIALSRPEHGAERLAVPVRAVPGVR